MKKLIVSLMIAGLLIPAAAMAMSHGDHGKKEMDHGKMEMDHGSMEKMDHGKMEMDHGEMSHGSGMEMGGDKIIVLQDVEVDGVMATGHLMDVKEKMAEHGMSMTHHLMVGFMNSEGEEIDKGQVAVKIEAPDGQVSKAIRMMGMDDQFGADVTLDQQGMYKFMVGTKLADGKKRTFHLHYQNK